MAPKRAVAAGALLLLAAWWVLDHRGGPSVPPPPSGPDLLEEPREPRPAPLAPAGPLAAGERRAGPQGRWLSGLVLAAPGDRPLPGANLSLHLLSEECLQPRLGPAVASACSGPNGSFRIGPAAPSASLLLVARAAGHAELRRALDSGMLAEPVTIRLEPGRSVAGVVLDAGSGAPLPGARVAAREGQGPETETDPAGRFLLEGLPRDRAATLIAATPTHAAAMIAHAPGEPEPRFLLTAHRALRLRLLLPPRRQAPARIRITGMELPAPEERHPASAFAPGPWVCEEPWPPQGILLLRRFGPGSHRLRVESLGGPALAGETEPFALEPEGVLDLVLDLLPAPVLQGRVLDERGAPLAGVEVWTTGGGSRVRTDEAGRFRLEPAPAAPGVLLARRRGLAALALDIGQGRRLQGGEVGDLVLPDRTGRVAGTVRDGQGNPLDGALVLLASSGLPAGEWFARTARGGRFELGDLPWGRWELFLLPPGSSPPLSFAGESPRARFEFTPAQPRADLSLGF